MIKSKDIIMPLVILVSLSVNSQASDLIQPIVKEDALMSDTIDIRNNYRALLTANELNFSKVLEKKVKHNETDATLYRFEPEKSINLYKTNTSIVLDSNKGNVLGLSRIMPEYSKEGAIQVSKNKAKEVMLAFVSSLSPELLNNYKVQWIDEHDEDFIFDGKKVIVSGMKVKCRDLNTGLYFWVIVAPDESVMIFEKEIEWDFIRAGRQTQKWLHDSYLENKI